VGFSALFMAGVISAQEDFAKIREELLSVARKEAACKVDANGLPRRVIITRNGAGLFAKPGEDKPIRNLSVFERLYLFVEKEGGFHRVGPDPFTPEGSGWVSEDFCLMWNTREGLLLRLSSASAVATRIHMWPTLDQAKEGDPAKAILSEPSHREEDFVDIILPVLERDELRQYYKVALTFDMTELSLAQLWLLAHRRGGVGSAWLGVPPGPNHRIRVLTYIPDWELTNIIIISTLLGGYAEIKTGKDEVKNVEALVLTMMGASVADKSGAGLEISGTAPEERVDGPPPITEGVKRLVRDREKNEAKIRGLVDLWRKRDTTYWNGNHVWVPVDLLP
jgi:hypothetical protein